MVFRFIQDVKSKLEQKHSNSYLLVSYLKLFFDVNLWIVFVFRVSTIFVAIRLLFVAKLFWLTNRILFSVDIDPRADLAGGLTIVHGMGIVIGHEVKSLGKLKIYQGVTAGGNMGKRKEVNNVETGQPVIDAEVVLGINACLLGPILIGSNSLIGANSVVTKDIAPFSVVVGTNQVKRNSS